MLQYQLLSDPIPLTKTSRRRNSVVVILGASGGIGSATAILADGRGDKVCVYGHRNQKAASALVTRSSQTGAESIAVRANLAVKTYGCSRISTEDWAG